MPGCGGKPHEIAATATVIFMKDDLLQKGTQAVLTVDKKRKINPVGKLFQGRDALLEFTEWMNIGIVKKTADRHPFLPQEINGINGTGATTDMEHHPHDWTTLKTCGSIAYLWIL